jgi:hypothetical protein
MKKNLIRIFLLNVQLTQGRPTCGPWDQTQFGFDGIFTILTESGLSYEKKLNCSPETNL